MPDLYHQLLDATIDHLRDLKAHGARFVSLEPGTLAALTAPVAARKPAPKAAEPVARPAASISTPPAPVSRPPAPITPVIPAAPVTAPNPVSAAAPALSREAKESAMAELRQRTMICQKCPHLAASRKSVVFGVGDIHSPLLFVGEAPGADEDEQGEPFVGKAGQLLTKIIQTMGYSRQTVYIANILKCRPDTPGEAVGNRKPTPEEMKTCLPYLLEQIDLIQPKLIVALGATAVEGLLGKTIGITKLRGNWQTFRNIPLMPTYHPAYLLHNQALSEKRHVWEDMLQVLEKLDAPISEKQRGYFLKG